MKLFDLKRRKISKIFDAKDEGMLSPFEDDKLKRLKFNKFKAYRVRHSDGYESKDNNIIYTYHNEKENKDVYMVALRGDDGKLIGYYEKHEYRSKETAGLYQPIR